MARIWDPSSVGDAMREQLRARFTEAEMAEPGSFAGGQGWIRILGTGRGEGPAETALGLCRPSAFHIGQVKE